MTPAVLKQLADARQALISTDTRNPLVHFRRPAKSLQVLPTSAAALVSELLQSGRHLSFLSVEAPAPSAGQKPSALRTTLSEPKLITTLTKLYREAATLLTEQGVQALYLGAGFLEWYESPSSDTKRYAPLCLMPVTLERKNVSSGYRLVYSGDDLTGNEPLALRLKEDFGIELPPFDGENLDVEQYLAAVARAVGGQKRWTVHPNDAHLGLFSFSRYLMARDLEVDAWPSDQALASHPVVQALLGSGGFTKQEPLVPEGDLLDKHLRPSTALHVADADSSQALAIQEVSAGRNLLIQGPPGTGKSQTITNIIADAVAQGHTVLFVAEKMAALEVVKRRLTQLGLGQLVLELHGHQTRRKAFIDQLKAARLAQEAARTSAVFPLQGGLDRSTEQLNAYVEALHTPLERHGLTPYQAFGQWAALGDLQAPAFQVAEVSSWDLTTFQTRLANAQLLQAWVAEHGAPKDHPFAGSQAQSLMPLELQQVRAALEAAADHLQQARGVRDGVQQVLGLDVGSSLLQLDQTALGILHAGAAPDLQGVNLTRSVWEENSTSVREGIERGRRQAEVHAAYEAVLTPEAWTTVTGPWQQELKDHQGKWWRSLAGRYRTARSNALKLYRSPGKAEDSALIEMLQALSEAAEHRSALDRLDPLLRTALGSRWAGVDTNFTAAKRVAEWMTETVANIREGRLPSWTADLAGNPVQAQTQQRAATALQEHLVLARQHLREAGRLLQLELSLEQQPLSSAEQSLRHRLASSTPSARSRPSTDMRTQPGGEGLTPWCA